MEIVQMLKTHNTTHALKYCIGYLDEACIVDKTKYEVLVVNVETKQTLSKFEFACYPDTRQIIVIAMDADGYLIF